MPTDDRMTINERRKYLRAMQKRYLKADRQGRGELLDEMELITSYHRKSLIRLMRGSLSRKVRTKQRGRTYSHEVDDALRVISRSNNHICAERQTPNLVQRAIHLASHGELQVSPTLLDSLGRINVSTVRRILKRIRQDEPSLPHRSPIPPKTLTRLVPMRRIPWDERTPGHFEVDLVHHGGPSSSGEYVHTLQMVDVATGWSERAALLGRSPEVPGRCCLVVQDAFQRVKNRLPFGVLEIHPDNGSEFFNHHMLRFFGEAFLNLKLSRSRPYRKNDNRFVEQKNSTLVRAYLGYKRFDTVHQTAAINQLYEKLWLYDNFFQPVMRLKEKIITPSQNGQLSRIRRVYDQAKTPFERLCETKAISKQDRDRLQALYSQTNPLRLVGEIYKLMDQIYRLRCAAPGDVQDVHETLATPLSQRKEKGSPVTFSSDRMTSSR